MPDTVSSWLGLVEALYPTSDASPWDRPGLQVGDPHLPVDRVLVALDVTSEVLAEAAAIPSTLLLAHHPLLLQPLERLTTQTAQGRLALLAARTGVAVAAAHTNLDAADDGAGTSDPVVNILQLDGVTPLCAPASPGGRRMGRVGRLAAPLSLGEVAQRLRAGLPSPALRLVGDRDREVRIVAVLGGSGTSAIPDAIAAGADVLVTGDVRHHVALDALELGLALIDAGHYATESAAMPAFAARLRTAAAMAAPQLGAAIVLSTTSTDPWELP